jgi:hypothetical protein
MDAVWYLWIVGRNVSEERATSIFRIFYLNKLILLNKIVIHDTAFMESVNMVMDLRVPYKAEN